MTNCNDYPCEECPARRCAMRQPATPPLAEFVEIQYDEKIRPVSGVLRINVRGLVHAAVAHCNQSLLSGQAASLSVKVPRHIVMNEPLKHFEVTVTDLMDCRTWTLHIYEHTAKAAIESARLTWRSAELFKIEAKEL